MNKNPDTESFPEINQFGYTDFRDHFDGFEEFYIYTGDKDEDEIIPVKAKEVVLEFYDRDRDELYVYNVPKSKLPEFDEKDYTKDIEK